MTKERHGTSKELLWEHEGQVGQLSQHQEESGEMTCLDKKRTKRQEGLTSATQDGGNYFLPISVFEVRG